MLDKGSTVTHRLVWCSGIGRETQSDIMSQVTRDREVDDPLSVGAQPLRTNLLIWLVVEMDHVKEQ